MDIRKLQEALEELIFVGHAHKTEIFRELYKRNDTAAGLAQRLGFDQRTTTVLLEALAEMRYLEKVDDYYRVTDEVYERLVNKKGERYEGDFWQFLLYLIDPWKSLPHVLKKGKPDKKTYKNLSMDDFIRGMDSPWKKKLAPEIVGKCLDYCPGAKSAADIGGAPGTMAKEFARRGLKTTVYDLPVSMAVMKSELSKIKNITIAEGDATESLPGGPFDIAFLGNICHGQSPKNNEKMISLCFDELKKGGCIVIFDNIRGQTPGAARVALHMITQSEQGDIYTKKQYVSWLEKAGFSDIKVEKLTEPAWKLILAKK
ncbi:MAG TPA: methyltransferase [Spirochaetota bacterium]|nr:methyltransferase [Spirochaetota bacterium]HPI87996.1 methyltransferase [Spirochaetota bacterium]HPR46706.1 methyltransferase [Spirochaetota bacterium]